MQEKPLQNGEAADSPVELVEIILRDQPEVSPTEKQKEGSAQDGEPCTLPLQGQTENTGKSQRKQSMFSLQQPEFNT